MKKTKKIISALLSIVFIAAFSITSNDSILVFKNLSISASAETTSSGFVYTVSGTTATITGYTGSSEYLTIPSTITNNGITYTVKKLSYNAFRENSTIKRVYISSGIQNIGQMCFYKCSNLTYISIPNTIQRMYSYCFQLCKNLTTVSFASNSILTEIPTATFASCSSLTSISIPDSVKRIGMAAFDSCSNLNTVSINYLSSKLEYIEMGAFTNCYNLSNVVLPKSVKKIGVIAFENCRGISSLNVPSSVINIYNGAYRGCTALTQVTFEGNSQAILSVGLEAFKNCSSLKTVNINKYKNIDFGKRAFSDCTSLTTVNYPKATYNGNNINVLDGIAFSNDCFLNTPYYTNNCTTGVYPSLVNRGSAKNCTGKQLVVSVFLNATINGTNQTWSDSEMTDKNQQVKTATDYIKNQSSRYSNTVTFENANTNSNLSLLIPNNNISITVPSSNTIWNITVNGTSKSLQTMLREQLQTYNMMPDTLKSQYSADGVSYVVFIEYNGRSSMMCLSDIDIVSLVRPGNSAADDTARSITHELMHCYGAPDIYGDSVAAYSQVKYYYDIMRVAGISLNSLNVNTYAAYCVGWTNTLLTEDAVAYDFS